MSSVVSREHLPDAIRALPSGRVLLDRLSDETSYVYLAGGAVRDLLLGRRPRELDLVVEGDPAPLAARLGASRRSHERFGTITVAPGYDLARARTESYPHAGALPEVRPATIDEDLPRRDFTVNAIAFGLTGPRRHELLAVPHALEDLAEGRLRVLHDDSFRDDPTRLLRMARYAARLRFAPESHTAALAGQAAGTGALGTVSSPRIGNELRLLAREPDPVGALEWLERLGIASPLGLVLDAPLARCALALLESWSLMDDDASPGLLALGLAYRGTAREDLRRRLDALAFPAEARDRILAVAGADERLAARLREVATVADLAVLLGSLPPEAVAALGALGAQAPATRWMTEARHVRLAITGGDLEAAGIPRGPAIGRGLRAALTAKLDGRAHDREGELAVALAAARDG
jgi:tRNA nucleotidyltransferase (CCA-adding enzyme)